MSYTPTAWQTGDVVTAEKLNKLEGGVAALSNYDIVFTQTFDDNDNMVLTADGASPEELVSGGYKKALYVIDDDGAKTFKNIGYYPKNIENATVAAFYFFTVETGVQPVTQIAIATNGLFTMAFRSADMTNITRVNGTYTYSNGHYVFTPSESGGGSAGG